MEKLSKCEANFVPLSPVTFLQRAAAVYADRTSVIYGNTHFTWRQTYDRCCRLASSLRSLNISKNDVVSVLAPNIPALYEMHFAVPMAGAVLNAINTRLDAANVATILRHSEAKAFFVDYEYRGLARDALNRLATSNMPLPLIIVIDNVDSPIVAQLGELEYEQMVELGNPAQMPHRLVDEWDPIALNYTSGTTSAPKGVVYSHRGAYLSTISLLLQWGVGSEPVYLWSLPMFHCNGWTFTWGMVARGGTNVCIRSSTSDQIHRAIQQHRVTHMCCAPVLFNILLEDGLGGGCQLAAPIEVLTGGAPPPATLLEKVERLRFRITHAYGLTEVTGPALVCEWRTKWDALPTYERAKIKARQGVSVLSLANVDVQDMQTMTSVPQDGKTMGEIVIQGSSVMKGYLKNDEETTRAMKGGWFRTGDVGVVHPDGYIEIRDRSKDVIISGGENISSVEVEAVLYRHPAVLEAAVVAMPHPHWGETPCVFIALKREWKDKRNIREEEIVTYCKSNMSSFMVPKKVVVVKELPKTSTGKVLKFQLREMAKGLQVSWPSQPKQVNKMQSSKKPQIVGSNNQQIVESEEQMLALSRL